MRLYHGSDRLQDERPSIGIFGPSATILDIHEHFYIFITNVKQFCLFINQLAQPYREVVSIYSDFSLVEVGGGPFIYAI